MVLLALVWLLTTADADPTGTGTGACPPALSCVESEAPVSLARRLDSRSRFAVAGSPARSPQTGPALMPRAPAPAGTVDGPQQLFEYSDGYATRLTIHRIASYATLPLFIAQYFVGEELLRNRESPAGWAEASHGPLAVALAGLFAVNTVTGGLNALEARRDPNVEGRTTLHTMLMLVADAGFVLTGVTASSAGTVGPTGRIRTKHRKTALISMGIASVGYLIMIPPLRRD